MTQGSFIMTTFPESDPLKWNIVKISQFRRQYPSRRASSNKPKPSPFRGMDKCLESETAFEIERDIENSRYLRII